MTDESLLIGATINLQELDLERRITQLMSYGITWLQVYVNPGTTNNRIQLLKSYPVNRIVHVAHETHGFNFSNGTTRLNRRLVDQAVSAAAQLGANFIVLHPSYLTEEQWGATVEEDLDIGRKFDGLVDYVKQQVGGRYRVLAENMPKWERKQQYLFHYPVDAFYGKMERAGFGFCLDLASVAVTTNSYPHFVFSPPPDCFADETYAKAKMSIGEFGNGRLAMEEAQERQMRHKIAVEDFLTLKPELMHVRGVGYWDVMRVPRPMTDLNNLQLQLVVPYCKANGVPIIVETSPHQQMLDIPYIKQQFERFS